MTAERAPERIRLSRAKGWRMPPNTMKVDRATRWGNPFNRTQIGIVFTMWGMSPEQPAPIIHLNQDPSLAQALDLYAGYLWGALRSDPDLLRPLRGKNLACWCPLDAPCHADVLLELANKP